MTLLHDLAQEALDQLNSQYVAADCDLCGGEGSWEGEYPHKLRMIPVQHKPDCLIRRLRDALEPAKEVAP